MTDKKEEPIKKPTAVTELLFKKEVVSDLPPEKLTSIKTNELS